MIIIGIDPGVQTGVAVYDTKKKNFEELRTMKLHDAFELVLNYKSLIGMVRVEDARKRTGGFAAMDARQEKSGAAVREGVGSVKRDCTAWEDFLIAKGIPHEMVKPGRAKTKITGDFFRKLTGWAKKVSIHARDAGMMVWGF
ncbi:MAG: hypothetical protein EOP49_18995 [Sphingobacteriales bacterium]|nr:MAG: hypothetical protein EOP49_18995 [Sphingobacteriales bacterium]